MANAELQERASDMTSDNPDLWLFLYKDTTLGSINGEHIIKMEGLGGEQGLLHAWLYDFNLSQGRPTESWPQSKLPKMYYINDNGDTCLFEDSDGVYLVKFSSVEKIVSGVNYTLFDNPEDQFMSRTSQFFFTAIGDSEHTNEPTSMWIKPIPDEVFNHVKDVWFGDRGPSFQVA
jgi:hypothetical protein